MIAILVSREGGAHPRVVPAVDGGDALHGGIQETPHRNMSSAQEDGEAPAPALESRERATASGFVAECSSKPRWGVLRHDLGLTGATPAPTQQKRVGQAI